jgi:hypothetical protein
MRRSHIKRISRLLGIPHVLMDMTEQGIPLGTLSVKPDNLLDSLLCRIEVPRRILVCRVRQQSPDLRRRRQLVFLPAALLVSSNRTEGGGLSFWGCLGGGVGGGKDELFVVVVEGGVVVVVVFCGGCCVGPQIRGIDCQRRVKCHRRVVVVCFHMALKGNSGDRRANLNHRFFGVMTTHGGIPG